jgi:hypothetical protein
MAIESDGGSGFASLLASSVPFGPWGRIALVAGNVVAWAEGVDVGALASAISVSVFALATVGIAIWERTYQQQRKHKLQDHEDRLAMLAGEEEARRASLAAQVAELTAKLREAIAAREADLSATSSQVERLQRTIELLGETVEQQAAELSRLNRRSVAMLGELGVDDPGTGEFNTQGGAHGDEDTGPGGQGGG